MSLPGTEQLVRAPWLEISKPWRPPGIIECPHYFQSRTLLNKQNVPTWPNGTFLFSPQVVFWQAADPYLFNAFPAGNRDYLLVQNTNLSLPRNVIIHSYPEPVFNRRGEMVVIVDAGMTTVIGPIPKLGYMQGDGNIWIDGQTAEILFLPMTFS